MRTPSSPTSARTRLSAGVAVVALVGAIFAVAPAAAAPPLMRSSGDYRLGADANPLRGKSGPALAVNPANPNHIVEMHQDLLRQECEYNVSTDGGATWRGGEFQAPSGYPVDSPGPCSVLGHGAQNVDQSGIEFGTGNNVYATFTSTRNPAVAGYSLLFTRSTDGGATFPVATEVLPGGATGDPDYSFPELTVDRGAGTAGADRIYIAVREARSSKALVLRSDDAGATWSAPVEASDVAAASPTYDCSTSPCTVTSKGDINKRATELTQPVLGRPGSGGAAAGVRPLYLAWRTLKSGNCGATPPGNCVGPPNNETASETAADGYIVLATSLDSGASWTRTRVINARGFIYSGPVTPPYSRTPTYFQASNFPRLAVDPTNDTMYLTFNHGQNIPESDSCGTGPFPGPGSGTHRCPSYGSGSSGFRSADHFIGNDNDVWFMRSENSGASWTNPKQINDPKQTGLVAPEVTQTRHPNITIGPAGRVDLVWQDRRHWYLSTSRRASDTGVCTHTHVACDDSRLGDTYFVTSDDKGNTFSANRRVNDRSTDLEVGFDYRFSTYWDYGPVAVPIGANQLLVASMDSREGNYDNDTQDIYLRKVNLAGAFGPAPVDHMGSGAAPGLSVAFSKRANPGGSEALLAATFTTRAATRVVIVNEGDVAAAAVGSTLARANVGPLLATPAASLSAEVGAEVRRMRPIGAFIIGHRNAVSDQVVADLEAAGIPRESIVRFGADSAAQAAAVAREALDRRSEAHRTNGLPAFDAVIVTRANTAESASASALAANRRLPILYVDRDGVPAVTADALRALNITRSFVVGGSDIVSDAVMASLPNATRLGGANQYETSDAVVRESITRGLPKNIVYVADGEKPMHAALEGAAVARLGGILMLTPGASTSGADAKMAAFGLPPVDKFVTSTLTRTAPLPRPSTEGYRLVASDGGIFTFGARLFHGSTGGIILNKPIVGGATVPTTQDGYWIVASDGGVFSFNAPFFGSLGGTSLPAPAVEIEPTPSGRGYWVVLANGQVHAFGDAKHHGEITGPLNKPVIGMSVSPSGTGYWLVAGDGGIFSFGDADFHGSTGAMRLNAPVVDLAPTHDGNGYFLAAEDGGVFSFGSAVFKGSAGSIKLNKPVVAMLVAPSGAGYWLGASDGGVFTFGAADFLGSMGGTKLNGPVLDMIE